MIKKNRLGKAGIYKHAAGEISLIMPPFCMLMIFFPALSRMPPDSAQACSGCSWHVFISSSNAQGDVSLSIQWTNLPTLNDRWTEYSFVRATTTCTLAHTRAEANLSQYCCCCCCYVFSSTDHARSVALLLSLASVVCLSLFLYLRSFQTLNCDCRQSWVELAQGRVDERTNAWTDGRARTWIDVHTYALLCTSTHTT